MQNTVGNDFKRRLFDPPRGQGVGSSSLKRGAMDYGASAPAAKRSRFTHPSPTVDAQNYSQFPYLGAPSMSNSYASAMHSFYAQQQLFQQMTQSSFAWPHPSYLPPDPSFSPLPSRPATNGHQPPPHSTLPVYNKPPARPIIPLPRRPMDVGPGNPLSGGVRLGGGAVSVHVAKPAAALVVTTAAARSEKAHSTLSLLSRIGPKVTDTGSAK